MNGSRSSCAPSVNAREHWSAGGHGEQPWREIFDKRNPACGHVYSKGRGLTSPLRSTLALDARATVDVRRCVPCVLSNDAFGSKYSAMNAPDLRISDSPVPSQRGGKLMAAEYAMSFTAGALLHRECVLIAGQFLRERSWDAARKSILAGNLLQARSRRTTVRLLGEVISRLKTLTKSQLSLLIHGSEEDQRNTLWLAICKRYAFIQEFAIEVVRERFLQLGPPITRGDYEAFYNAKAAWHPELEDLGQATRDKLRQNLFKMLRDAGLLDADGYVNGVFLSPAVVQAVAQESAENLSVFPVREEDVERWARQ